MAEDLITLAKEKYGKAGEYGDASFGSGMASLFAKGMGAVLDYSALKTDLKNYNLQIKGTELGMMNVELQATEMANKLRQQYIEQAGNYAYNAARRGVAVSSGSVQSGLRRDAEDLGTNVQKINREAEIEKKNLQMQKVALQAEKKIKKHQARSELTMNLMELAASGAMAGQGGAGGAVGGKSGKVYGSAIGPSQSASKTGWFGM